MLDPNNAKEAHADARLRENVIAWLNTVRPDGRPHSVPVWFLWDGTTVLIFSKPKNQKIVNIRHNPHVLLALDDTKDGEDVVLLEGTAELVDDAGLAIATLPAYLAKYGTIIQQMGWSPESMAHDYSQAIRITPTRFQTF